MSTFLRYLGQFKKALVASIGIGAQLVALGVLHGDALHYVQVAIAVAIALGVYAVPNATSTATK